MCERCSEIDLRIAHYQRMVDGIKDAIAIIIVKTFLADLATEKIALHPAQPK